MYHLGTTNAKSNATKHFLFSHFEYNEHSKSLVCTYKFCMISPGQHFYLVILTNAIVPLFECPLNAWLQIKNKKT